ncbi:MAG: hypothetical protein ACOCQ1_00850 [Halanaerobiaceae bacterium]
MKKAIIVVILLMLVFISGGLEAQEETEESVEETNEETVQLKAGFLEYLEDTIELSEGITITKGEITVLARQGEYFREEKKAELEEEVEMSFEQGEIISRELTALLQENRYVFQQEVQFTRNEGEREFILRAPYLELNQDEDTFAAQEGVEIEYDERELIANEADYEGETEELVLTGDVLIEETNGDWISGDRAVFFLDEEGDNNFEVEGNVELEVDISS